MASNNQAPGYFVGLMSGTSLDAMDGVLADMSARPPQMLASVSVPFFAEVRERLLKLNKRQTCDLDELAWLESQISEMATQAVLALLKQSNTKSEDVRAIGYPGQTIAHNPEKHRTMQIGDPNILTEMTNITVVTDFRRRDMAAGGEGAPLASGFHQEYFADADTDRGIINMGGISNLTMIFNGTVVGGFDLGPANCLMDEWAEKHLDMPFDDRGEWARSGECINELLYSFLQDPYFSRTPPKSTGRAYFNLRWGEGHIKKLKISPKAEDVQATFADLTALCISLGVCEEIKPRESAVLYLSGGGTKNTYLVERIKKLVHCEIRLIDELGVAAQWVEPLAFAWLAKCALEKKPGNLPVVTRAKGERPLGGIYRH